MSLIGHSPWGHITVQTTVEFQISDCGRSRIAETDSRIVMAEQSTHDVVNQARSVGDPSPSDVSALNPINSNAVGDVERIATSTSTHKDYSSESDKLEKPVVADVDVQQNGTEPEENATGTGNVSLCGASTLSFMLIDGEVWRREIENRRWERYCWHSAELGNC